MFSSTLSSTVAFVDEPLRLCSFNFVLTKKEELSSSPLFSTVPFLDESLGQDCFNLVLATKEMLEADAVEDKVDDGEACNEEEVSVVTENALRRSAKPDLS